MTIPWYRMPDGGVITTPRINIRKPRGVYTKGPIVGRPTPIRLSANKQVIATYGTKPRTTTTSAPSAPKLGVPSGAGYTPTSRSPAISLPGMAPGGSAASIVAYYRRSPAELQKLASQAVHLEVDPQVSALGSAYNQENSNYGYLINTLRKQLGLSKGDINTLYKGLDVALQMNAQKQAQITAATKSDMNKVYDTAISQLGSTYGNAQKSTADELKRMGIANPQANDRLTADQAYLQGLERNTKASSGSLLDAIGASNQGLMTGLRGGNQAASAMLQSQLQQQFDKQSADALQSHLAKLAEIKMQKDILSRSIPSKVNQTYAALLDQQYQREMDAAQKLFDNQIKLGNYQLGVQNAQTSSAYRQNQLALEAQRIALAKQKSAGATKPLTGMDKALAYVKQISDKTKIPYSQLEYLLMDAINGDPNRTDYPGFNKSYMSSYANDIQHGVTSRGYPSLYGDMIKAMQYWFGG